MTDVAAVAEVEWPTEGKPGQSIVLDETEQFSIVRTFSEAGYTTSTEWKKGYEPPAPKVCKTCGQDIG